LDIKFYKKIIEESPVGYSYNRIICDPSGIPLDFEIIEANFEFCMLTGMNSVEASGGHASELLPELSKTEAGWLGAFGDVALNGGEKDFEQFSDVLKKWIRLRVHSPEPFFFIIRMTDVTREHQWRESEEKYRQIFEHTPLGVFHFDQNGCITECNDNFVNIIGSSRQKLNGLDMYQLPDHRVGVALSEALKGRTTTYEGDYRSYTADKITSVRIIFAPILIDAKVEGGVAIVEDITERLQAEEALLQSSETWKAIITASPDGIGLISLDGKLKFVSEKLAAMYGHAPKDREALIGSWAIDFIDPSFHRKLTENICNLLAGKQNNLFSEYLAVKRDGTRFYIEVTSTVLKDPRGKPSSILIIERDITARKASEDALRISEEKYIAIFDESPIAIELYNSEGRLTHVNNACLELFGISDMQGISEFNLFDDPNISAETKAELFQNKHVRFEGVFDFDLVKSLNLYETSGAGKMHLDISIKSMLNDKIIDGYIVQILNITKQKKAQEQIEYLSYRDGLTGLFNRRFYEEELMRLDVSRNLPLALVMADVNGLKLINDSFGHVLGDQLLQKTANILSCGCRQDDIIARLGGDEFVILLPNTTPEETDQIINRIKYLATQETVGAVGVSISFGYAIKNHADDDIQEVFKNAEDYMYRNKLYESSSVKNKTIKLIMNTLYEKSNREMLNSKGVSRICERIASRMGFSQDEINQISAAGLVHDIGKMGVDERILNKKETLNSEDWGEIKRHPEIGYRILSSSSEFSELGRYVLEHQEWWDGSGYPKGIREDEISLQARIIAVADAYDAMTGERTYKARLTPKDAIMEIKCCSGTQFDPSIVSILVAIASESEGMEV